MVGGWLLLLVVGGWVLVFGGVSGWWCWLLNGFCSWLVADGSKAQAKAKVVLVVGGVGGWWCWWLVVVVACGWWLGVGGWWCWWLMVLVVGWILLLVGG